MSAHSTTILYIDGTEIVCISCSIDGASFIMVCMASSDVCTCCKLIAIYGVQVSGPVNSLRKVCVCVCVCVCAN